MTTSTDRHNARMARAKEVIENKNAAVDTVTEMSPVKHAFSAGIKAMAGKEW